LNLLRTDVLPESRLIEAAVDNVAHAKENGNHHIGEGHMQNVDPSEALQFREHLVIKEPIWGPSLACGELKEKFQDGNEKETDQKVAWVYQQRYGPGERELPLLEAVGDINEVDDDEEKEEDRDIVHDNVDVKGDKLQPVDHPKGAQDRWDVLDDGRWAPHLP